MVDVFESIRRVAVTQIAPIEWLQINALPFEPGDVSLSSRRTFEP